MHPSNVIDAGPDRTALNLSARFDVFTLSSPPGKDNTLLKQPGLFMETHVATAHAAVPQDNVKSSTPRS